MFRSALVGLRPSADREFIIEPAVALAARERWALTGCSAIDSEQVVPCEPVPLGAGHFEAQRREQLMLDARSEATQLTERFQQACGEADVVACDTLVAEGDFIDVMGNQSHRHDVLLVGAAKGGSAGETFLRRLLVACPRPAIILPANATAGENILIAYDGSYQSARALESFVASGLSQRRQVHVASIAKDAEVAAAHCEAAGQYLAHHNIDAVLHAQQAGGGVAQFLLELALQTSAGMLVMGAFGKPSFRELFVGSVTRNVLRSAALPVFLDH